MSANLPGQNTLNYLGTRSTRPPQQFFKDRAPLTTDNSYSIFAIGDEWLDRSATVPIWYKLVSNAAGNAIWRAMTGSTATVGIDTINGIFPDLMGNFGLNAGANISVTPGVNAVTLAVTGTTDHAIQVGNATGSLTSLPAALNGQIPIGSTGVSPVISNITAGSNVSIVNGPGSIVINAVGGGGSVIQASFYAYLSAPTLNMETGDGTIFTIPYDLSTYNISGGFNGIGNNFTAPDTAVYLFTSAIGLANIQPTHTEFRVFLQVTGGSPGTYLMAEASTSAERTGANYLEINSSIQVEMTSGDIAVMQIQVGPAGQPKVIGIDGGSATMSGYWSGSTLQGIANASLSWQSIFSNTPLVNGHGYFCVAPGGNLSLTLPTTSVVGDTIWVKLRGASSWTIVQTANQQIFVANGPPTTLGVAGTLASTDQGDTVQLICRTASLVWEVVSYIGNLAVT